MGLLWLCFYKLTFTTWWWPIPTFINVTRKHGSTKHLIAIGTLVNDRAQIANGSIDQFVGSVRNWSGQSTFDVYIWVCILNIKYFVCKILQIVSSTYICKRVGIHCRNQFPSISLMLVQPTDDHRHKNNQPLPTHQILSVQSLLSLAVVLAFRKP